MTMAVKGGEASAASVVFDNTFKFDAKRNELEQAHVIQQLPRLFEIDEGQCRSRVIPLIEAVLIKDTDVQLHSAAATSYLELISSRNLSENDAVSLFLPAILRYVDHRDADVRNTWLNVLLDVIKILPEAELDKLCYYALEKCHENEEFQRCIGAQILGRICSTVSSTEANMGNIANTKIWPVLQMLSQDVKNSVRASVCQQLHYVAPVLNVAVLKRSLIPCIIELARDGDKNVLAEALEACVKLTALLPVGVLKTSLLPLIISVANRANNLKKLRPIHVRLAANLAPLWNTLVNRGVMEPNIRVEISRIFQTLALDAKNRRESVESYCLEVRRLCAESLPVVLNVSHMVGKIFDDFVGDPFPEVRKAAAVSLAKCVNNPAFCPMLVRPLQELLLDDNESVISEVVFNLNTVVDQLCSNKAFVLITDPNRQSLANAILTCGRSINDSRNWRLVEQYYLQMSCVVSFLSSQYIYQHFYPRVSQRIISSGALPIRHAACRSFLIFLRFNLDPTQRQKMREWLREKLQSAQSCYHRLLFIYVSQTATELFSRDYFNTHFMKDVISLKDDPVVNVRLALAMQLPKLFSMAKGNSSDLIRETRASMSAKEKDRDVIMALKTPLNSNDELNDDEDRRRKEEETKLGNLTGSSIARVKQTSLPRAASVKSLSSSKKPPGPTVKRPSNRTNRINHVCTCERNAQAMEMSWLNLEMELRRELRTFRVYHTNKRGTIFSCSFDQDFYRDAGVLPEQVKPPKPTQAPPLLSQTGRSKSFVLSTKQSTRIPISHRRSMDVNSWSSKNFPDSPNVSRLPVRYVPKEGKKPGR